jgi:DNA-binding beta-propeller fold protein YncE
MVIGKDTGSGALRCLRAAWSPSRTWLPGSITRAVRCRAGRGVIAITVAGSLGLLAGLGAAPASGSVSGGSIAQPAPGTQLWVSRYNGSGNGTDTVRAAAASPDGKSVFVTGTSYAANNHDEFTTVAYDAVTGTQRWASLYDFGGGFAVAVSPDGKTVFVTGQPGYTTIAYDAATGAQLWVKHYVAGTSPKAVVASPDGSTVYVTGTSPGTGTLGHPDYVTIAYNAATGARRWLSRYRGFAAPRAIAISRDGRAVYVTGQAGQTPDAATVAYNAATGARLWARRYNGRANNIDAANSVAVAPGGRTVYITGGSRGKTSRFDLFTVAYRAGTGAQLWADRYNGPGNRYDSGRSVAVTPDGRTVVVAGPSAGAQDLVLNYLNYATIAYNARTGAQRWLSRWAGLAVPAEAKAMVLSPGGSTVFVTGDSNGDYATVAYATATGAQLWVSVYDAGSVDEATGLAVSPDGGRLYVTGTSYGGPSTDYDWATVAYHT